MKKIKPSIPRGTRDFGSNEMIKREYIFSILKKIFSNYGFQNIETPSFENIDILKGNYGEEGDKLLYNILDSGDFLKNIKIDSRTNYKNVKSKISKKGLIYDLTVPLARYVSMNRDKISFPFKRYQIQKVWRADRPQRGRYREFYQCDIDYIGSNSILCEIEIIDIIKEVFLKLNYNNFSIKLNNRKVLAGIVEQLDIKERFTELCISIDKIDKIGISGLSKELLKQKFDKKNIREIIKIFEFKGKNEEKLNFIKKIIFKSKIGVEGIDELEKILNYRKNIIIDFTLARGLSYYTSSIFEVISNDSNQGSLAGGGRYDNLTEIFGLKNSSGIGISFGLERIFNLLEENKLFPKEFKKSIKVMVTNLGEDLINYSLDITKMLRENSIPTEMYLTTCKLKKQLQYANNKNIPFVIIVGEDEKKEKKVTVKNMISGNQKLVEMNKILNIINL
tara:strand:- start:2234 stop:3580 length:1347 start_codon:yes stop_codon:yes gene_type:complete